MRIRNPALVKSSGRIAAWMLRALFRTLRKELHTKEADPYGDMPSDRRYLFSVWHDSAVMATFGGPHRGMVALTSRHRDGTFVASIIGGVGVRAVRGSSGRGGQVAARELLQVAETNNIVMTPDGPRGPRRHMSRGIVYLASKTGNAIVPTAFACSNAWEIKGSWTTLTIPKPFSRVISLIDEPIRVPPALDETGFNSYTITVQEAMNELQVRAAQLIGASRDSESWGEQDSLRPAA